MSFRKQSNFIGKLIALAGVGAVGVWSVVPAIAGEAGKPADEASATIESTESETPSVVGNAPVDETVDAEPASNQVAARSSSTIVELASSSESFETLVAALEAAELTEVLQGEGPYTVFAPTDEAFAALPEGTVEELLKPENRETLVQILTYHVVPGEVTSSALSSGEVATVEGSPVTVTVGDEVSINNATVLQPDVLASNGVIHVIDQVIVPPSLVPSAGEPTAPTETEVPAAPTSEETVPATPQ